MATTTKTPSHPRDVQNILNSIRVKDSVAHEPEDPLPPGETRGLQTLLSVILGIAATCAIGTMMYLAWLVERGIFHG